MGLAFKVALSVHISSVACQAAALKNNHVNILIYYLLYNNAQRPDKLRVSWCHMHNETQPPALQSHLSHQAVCRWGFGAQSRGKAETAEAQRLAQRWQLKPGLRAMPCSSHIPLWNKTPIFQKVTPLMTSTWSFRMCPPLHKHPAHHGQSLTPSRNAISKTDPGETSPGETLQIFTLMHGRYRAPSHALPALHGKFHGPFPP